MKKIFFTGWLLLTLMAGFAQSSGRNNITGKVVDSATKAPLEYATVTLFLKGQTKPVNGATTDKNGIYSISDVRDSIFTIIFEFIGYDAYAMNGVSINKNTNLKTVSLSRKAQVLTGVTVVAKGKLVENKIDKMVYNAERDVTSQSGVATDVLKKIPMVSVDVDGNVQLAGSGGIRFLINGKPSTAFGSSIADVLQSIPASEIKTVEVITNPGAKYDAAGLGGIINIILKSNNTRGYNGNISLTASTRQENGSLNFNVRKGTFGLNAYASGNARLKVSTPFLLDRNTADAGNQHTILHQEGSSEIVRNGYQGGIGFDWSPQKKNNFSGGVSYYYFRNRGQSQDQQMLSGTSFNTIFSQINDRNNFLFKQIESNLNYKRTFNKEDRELEISINSSFGKDHSNGSSNQFIIPQDSLYYGTNSDNPSKINETEIKADYTDPIKENVILGLGSKVSLYDINSNSIVNRYDALSKQYLLNASLSNGLNYHQKVYAVYSEITFPAGKVLDVKVGGRYERTEIGSYYSNVTQQVKVPGYNTFVPSVYVSKKINDNESVKLGYSKRIERPEYRDLNPFVNTNDPKNLSAGNPFLLPETGHRIELSYNKEIEKVGSFFINLFYRINEHDIQPYIIYYPSFKVGDSTYTNVSVSTRQNIGMEKNAGLSLYVDLHLSDKITVRSNAFIFHRHTINEVEPNANSTSFNYRFNLNTTWQVTPTLVGEFFGNFNSNRHEAQGTYPSLTTYNFAIRKQFWNKKGSIAFTTTNPFNEYVKQATRLTGANFTFISTRKIPFRTFGLNFTWKFGKLEFKKEKEENENNVAPLD